MKKVITSAVLSVFLVACVSNYPVELRAEDPIQYINLIKKNADVLDYWVIKKRMSPKYPVHAARNGLSGCVNFLVGISAEGTVGEYKVINSYPRGVFENNAIVALNAMKWSATKKNVEKSPVLTKIQLDFRLQGFKNENETVLESQCGALHQS